MRLRHGRRPQVDARTRGGWACSFAGGELRRQLKLHAYGWHMLDHLGNFERREWLPARSARRLACDMPEHARRLHAGGEPVAAGPSVRFSPHFYTSQRLIDEVLRQVRQLSMH